MEEGDRGQRDKVGEDKTDEMEEGDRGGQRDKVGEDKH